MVRRARSPAKTSVEIAGQTVPLAVTWHPSARRFILRVDPGTGDARLTVPAHADLEAAISFLSRHEDWLTRERAKVARPLPFVDGARVPLRGEPHAVRLDPKVRRRVTATVRTGRRTDHMGGRHT